MPKKLSINWEIIKNTYLFHPDRVSLAELTKIVNEKGIKVSQGAIGNKAAKEGWVKQRNAYHDKINKAVAKRMSSSLIRRRTKNLKIVKAIINLGAKNLVKQLKENEIHLSAAEIDKMMRLEEFLSGEADSRSEKNIVTKKELGDMTEEELDELFKNVAQADFEVLDEK